MRGRKMSLPLGDFSGLADAYARFRPDYSHSVVLATLALLDRPIEEVQAVDVGAGTGIFTAMLADFGVRRITAIEPNDDMRRVGKAQSISTPVTWLAGRAEETGLPDATYDWVSMASSFHWADFDAAVNEFNRILKPGGRFVCLWNPRHIQDNPMLEEIEAFLYSLKPGLQRKSSGKGGITEGLSERLQSCGFFDDVVFLEGPHTIEMSPERYVGVWKSVNDVRAQLGESEFKKFLSFVEEKTAKSGTISCSYLTRAWSARKQ